MTNCWRAPPHPRLPLPRPASHRVPPTPSRANALQEMVEKGDLDEYSWVRHRTEKLWVQIGQLATPNLYPSLIERFKKGKLAKPPDQPFLPASDFLVKIVEVRPSYA